jgi:hypothetical protein
MVSRHSLNRVVARSDQRERRGNFLAALLLFFLAGCAPASPAGTVAPAPEATLPPDTPTPAPDYVEQIRNAQYQLGLSDQIDVVQLSDGVYQSGTAGEVDFVEVRVSDFIALGDLNNDGVNESVAIVSENYGGTGVFTFLALYVNQNVQPVFLTSVFIDDRPVIDGLGIENGEVFLAATTHDADDPFCCPTLRTERHYRLLNNQLEMTDYVTFAPDGRPRAIKIESPANGGEVFSSVQVRGTVAIAPFENTLTYRIYDVGGVELAVGAIAVTAADLGAPGAFDEVISLGNILSGAAIRIEIQDISAADGSLLAMDSVELVVK